MYCLRDLLDPFEYVFNRRRPLDLMYSSQLPCLSARARLLERDRSQSSFRADANRFQLLVNVKHFRPEEIDVKTVDNFVVIHGKHEETADEHGFVSREFTRRYQLPDDVEPETVTSSLSQAGVLTIQAPRKLPQPLPSNERIVPITVQQPMSVEDEIRQAESPVQPQQEEEQK